MRSGDLIATGTLSGPTREELGCFLESSWNGKRYHEMEGLNHNGRGDGRKTKRLWLNDGDVVEYQARIKGALGDVSFGPCRGQIVPANNP
jgi:fumarylacetoacetase